MPKYIVWNKDLCEGDELQGNVIVADDPNSAAKQWVDKKAAEIAESDGCSIFYLLTDPDHPTFEEVSEFCVKVRMLYSTDIFYSLVTEDPRERCGYTVSRVTADG